MSHISLRLTSTKSRMCYCTELGYFQIVLYLSGCLNYVLVRERSNSWQSCRRRPLLLHFPVLGKPSELHVAWLHPALALKSPILSSLMNFSRYPRNQSKNFFMSAPELTRVGAYSLIIVKEWTERSSKRSLTNRSAIPYGNSERCDTSWNFIFRSTFVRN